MNAFRNLPITHPRLNDAHVVVIVFSMKDVKLALKELGLEAETIAESRTAPSQSEAENQKPPETDFDDSLLRDMEYWIR